MRRTQRMLVVGAFIAASCGPAQPRTAAELVARAGLSPGPDVAVFVDGTRWGADTLDRLSVRAVQRMVVVRDPAVIAILPGQGQYRTAVLLSTQVPPGQTSPPAR